MAGREGEGGIGSTTASMRPSLNDLRPRPVEEQDEAFLQVHQAGAAGSMSAVTPAICCPSSDACTLAIDSGIGPEHKWIEGRLYLRRGDWAWRDRCLYRRGALPEALRAMVADLMDLLDRIDDLMAAQRDVGDVSH